jgi:putative polymerase
VLSAKSIEIYGIQSPHTGSQENLNAGSHQRDQIIAAILIASLLFNAVLSILNGHLFHLNQVYVIVAEASIIASCLLLIFRSLCKRDFPWLALLFVIVILNLASSAFAGTLNLKSIRDIAVIPIFVMLGYRYSASPIQMMLRIQNIVLFVMLFEGLFPELFSEIFRVQEYYVYTRGFAEEGFWNKDSTLFVSATRPDERFMLSFLDIHRLSSVFLEPVSLGNYACIAGIFVIAFWRDLSLRQRIWFTLSTFCILVGCDGRFALGSIVLILVLRVFIAKLPQRSCFVYLPAVLILAALLTFLFNSDQDQDNVFGRVAKTIHLLSDLELSDFIGATPANEIINHMDSGASYIIVTQTLFGAVVFWSAISLLPRSLSLLGKFVVHAICLYIACNLLVSYSMFSIKTASLLWFLYGVAIRNPPEPSSDRDRTARTLIAI